MPEKVISVLFYRTDSGREPVHEWLKGQYMVLLQGFIKKTEKIPDKVLSVAQSRLKSLKEYYGKE